MNLNDKIRFGKYKDNALLSIFQGRNIISNEILKEYAEYLIVEDPEISFCINIMEFIIVEDYFYAVPFDVDLFGNHSNNLKKEFVNYTGVENNLKGILSIDDVYKKQCEENEQFYNNLNGDPFYLERCIKNVKNFVINPETLLELEQTHFYNFKGFDFIYLSNNVYQFKPIIEVCHHKFSKEICDLNFQKINHQ